MTAFLDIETRARAVAVFYVAWRRHASGCAKYYDGCTHCGGLYNDLSRALERLADATDSWADPEVVPATRGVAPATKGVADSEGGM